MLVTRGVGAAHEPGAHEHRPPRSGKGPWSWFPGLPPLGHPGMTLFLPRSFPMRL